MKVFASGGAADAWLQENDPEGVAWEYEVAVKPQDRFGSTRQIRSPERLVTPIGSSFLPRRSARKNGLRAASQSATFGSTRFRSDAHECVR